MKLKLLLVALLSSFALANELTLQWLESKPRTYARDFHILQYLKQEQVTPTQAQEALGLVNQMNNQLLFAYVNRLGHDESTAVVQCMKMSALELLASYSDCIMVGLTIKKALQLNALQLAQIIQKIQPKYSYYADVLKLINSPIVFSKLVASNIDTFYEIYLNSPKQFRINKLNYRLSKRTLHKIQADKRFETLLRYVITNNKMSLAQQSFFEIDDTQLSAQSSFLLAINLISHKKEQQALPYLENAYKKAYFQKDKDKVHFWKYLITKDENHLKNILNSWDINIYSLYAKEHYNQAFNNIIYDVSQTKKQTTFNTQDQFSWIEVIRDIKKDLSLEKIKAYEQLFSDLSTKPHITFLYSRYNQRKYHYFINPYENLMTQYPQDRQILINAIARQESQFIPSSISTAYAQGVMQIMPFLSKYLASKLNETYDIFNMFKPDYSIRYANLHLNSLEKQFQHPLLIAYAYNGGGGFTKALFKNGFFKTGQYEPFMSMEKIPYNETKEYGKKVLTNYVIYYQKIKQKELKIKALLENLPTPSQLELE